jgi:hypothetical protein
VSFYDVSDVILDPDFRTTFALIRRTETVDELGTAHVDEQFLGGAGVMQPATPKERERLPEGDQMGEAVAVYSVTPLLAGDDQGQKPDRIAYYGLLYEVKSVEPWGNAPDGYCKALAVLVGTENF